MIERSKKIPFGLMLTIPGFIIIIFAYIFPIFNTIYKSFFKRVGYELVFVGLEGYLEIPKVIPYIQLIIQNTILYIVAYIFLTYWLGMIAALVLNEKFRGRGLFRAIILLPWAIPGVVTATIFTWLFDPTYGLANDILAKLGLPAINWLTDPNIALCTVILVGVWGGIPFTTLILLAGLGSISPELYDQAKVDGAGSWVRFRHITLPQLKGVSAIVILLQVLWSLGTFESVLIMTRGMPLHRSEIIGYTLWITTFRYLNFEQGYAITVLLFMIAAIIISLYLSLRKVGAS